MTKFLFIFERGIPMGGVETSMLRLAHALEAAGHKVKLFIHGGLEACHPMLMNQWKNLDHIFLTKAGEEGIEHVARQYALDAPAIVFPNQGPFAYQALRVAKLELGADLRIFGICHSDFPDYYQLAEDHQDIVDAQFGVSRHMCEQLDRRLQKPSKLLILGVEVPERYPERPKRKRMEILYTGRIENYGKRCCELIPAGEELRKRGVNFRMTIAGDGPYFKWLQQDLKKVPWWAWHHYRILGAVAPSDLVQLYRESDIYLSFTRFEGNSIAVMEAMAQGCVPVIPRVSGTETVMVHGETGWLGEVDKPSTLIEACDNLYHDRTRLAALSRNSWSHARLYCAVGKTVDTIIQEMATVP
jgi:glycosyltransferase involved in cell wall biosynthesis